MQDKASVTPNKPNVKFSKITLSRWFKKQGGNQKSPLEKPYLTADQKKNRVKWATEQRKLMEDKGDDFYCAFLDEKWFYTTSRRRKIKVLPACPHEDPNDVKPEHPRCISRRHPVKVICCYRHVRWSSSWCCVAMSSVVYPI